MPAQLGCVWSYSPQPTTCSTPIARNYVLLVQSPAQDPSVDSVPALNQSCVVCRRRRLCFSEFGAVYTNIQGGICHLDQWGDRAPKARVRVAFGHEGVGLTAPSPENCCLLWSPYVIGQTIIFMVALYNRADHYIFILFLSSSFFFFFFLFFLA